MDTSRSWLLLGSLLCLSRPGAAGAASLDKEVIRRVIRAHIHEVKQCYEGALAADPGLNGRVVVRFTVDARGSVAQAEITETTMKNQAVETCIAGAVRTWQFPRPAGKGVVVVTYPFVLKAAE